MLPSSRTVVIQLSHSGRRRPERSEALPGHHLTLRILVAGRTIQRGARTSMIHPHHLLSRLAQSSLLEALASRGGSTIAQIISYCRGYRLFRLLWRVKATIESTPALLCRLLLRTGFQPRHDAVPILTAAGDAGDELDWLGRRNEAQTVTGSLKEQARSF
jgi:hypothetical protein